MNLETLFTTFNTLVASGVLLCIVAATVLFIQQYQHSTEQKLIATPPPHKYQKKINTLLLILISVFVVVFPLCYQYLFGFSPCMLCWLQRICIWSSSLLILMSLWRGQTIILRPYITILLSIGTCIGLYHYSMQFNIAPVSIACGAVGQSVSCGGINVIVWQFMTIPLMSVLSQMSLVLLLRSRE
jgi:disulfide bond formation protein DsbB